MSISRQYMPSNWVGFESFFNDLDRLSLSGDRSPNWPPYNIKKIDDTNFAIELAISGFAIKDVVITSKENVLTIVGDQPTTDDNQYIYKGIASRKFSRSFTIADNVFIKNASLVNGMLTVYLERILLEAKKMKTIEILPDDPVPKIALT